MLPSGYAEFLPAADGCGGVGAGLVRKTGAGTTETCAKALSSDKVIGTYDARAGAYIVSDVHEGLTALSTTASLLRARTGQDNVTIRAKQQLLSIRRLRRDLLPRLRARRDVRVISLL